MTDYFLRILTFTPQLREFFACLCFGNSPLVRQRGISSPSEWPDEK